MQQENEFFRWIDSMSSGSDLDTQQAFATLQFIAINPDTPPAVLMLLAAQGSNKLAECVAGNPNCSPDLLVHLAHHECVEVRVALCDNSSKGKQVIDLLICDESPDVRYALAENHQLPSAILEQLCQDDNAYVAFRAGQTLQRIHSNAEGIGLAGKVVQWFSRRTNVSGAVEGYNRRLG